jgi:hypothetical protein
MKHASTRDVFDYWNEQRGARVAPERVDIDPAEIRRALGDTFILTMDLLASPHFRLAGTRLCALFGRELKSEAFAGLWRKAEQAMIRDHLQCVIEESTGIVAGVTGRNNDDSLIDLELLVLPLGCPDRKQARILGVLAPCTTPYWMGSAPVENLSLGTVRHLGAATVAAPRLVPSAEGRRSHGFVIYDGGRT